MKRQRVLRRLVPSVQAVVAHDRGHPQGAGLLEKIHALGWARRLEGTRVVQFSAPGLRAFEGVFGPVG